VLTTFAEWINLKTAGLKYLLLTDVTVLV